MNALKLTHELQIKMGPALRQQVSFDSRKTQEDGDPEFVSDALALRRIQLQEAVQLLTHILLRLDVEERTPVSQRETVMAARREGGDPSNYPCRAMAGDIRKFIVEVTGTAPALF